MKTNGLWIAGLCCAALMLLTGCPPEGVECKSPTVACGDTCVDPTFDSRNCGGCGLACQPGQICNAGVCACGDRKDCGGECVVWETNPEHCGACDNACTGREVCQATPASPLGACYESCDVNAPTSTQCGRSCVNLGTDRDNCGACGNACDDARVCGGGVCTFEVIFACRNFGLVRGVSSTKDGGIQPGPLSPMGTSPQSLASYADVLLTLDDVDRKLLQGSLATFAVLKHADGGDSSIGVGSVPNQVYVAAPYAYVANAFSNTLQIIELESDGSGTVDAGPGDAGFDGGIADAGFDAGFDAGIADAGDDAGFDGGADAGDGGLTPPPPLPVSTHPNGLSLKTIKEINFGANTNPNGAVVLGQFVYVPLYGGSGSGAAAGQKLAKVDINTKTVVDTFDLTTLDLGSFDGGTVLPRPYSVAAFGGKVYAALNNFGPAIGFPYEYNPAGPGMLAEYDPSKTGAAALSRIDLGAQRCLNPVSLAQSATTLFVGCGGKATYDSNFVLTAVENNGVLALERNPPVTGPLTVKATWVPTCPANSSCVPASIGRIGYSNGRLFVADQGIGRAWVVKYDGATFTDVTTINDACPPTDSTHFFSNVTDVLVP